MVTQKTAPARVQDMLKIMNVTNIAIATTAVIYTEAVGLPRNATFTVSFKATSSGNIKLKIEMEESNELPATEQTADSNWIVPKDAAEIDDELAVATKQSVAYSPAAMKYYRFKITGLPDASGNDASTVVDLLQLSYVLAI